MQLRAHDVRLISRDVPPVYRYPNHLERIDAVFDFMADVPGALFHGVKRVLLDAELILTAPSHSSVSEEGMQPLPQVLDHSRSSSGNDIEKRLMIGQRAFGHDGTARWRWSIETCSAGCQVDTHTSMPGSRETKDKKAMVSTAASSRLT